MLEAILDELRQEAGTTKRVLEAVPGNKLTWKPHSRSMSLGQLAIHVATIPGNISRLVQLDGFDVATAKFEPEQPKSAEAILSAFEDSMATAEAYLSRLDEAGASQPWRLTSKGKEISTLTRGGVIRSLMFNHWYHHRGQLSVYLRLLEVPVPSIYGPSADDNPFT